MNCALTAQELNTNDPVTLLYIDAPLRPYMRGEWLLRALTTQLNPGPIEQMIHQLLHSEGVELPVSRPLLRYVRGRAAEYDWIDVNGHPFDGGRTPEDSELGTQSLPEGSYALISERALNRLPPAPCAHPDLHWKQLLRAVQLAHAAGIPLLASRRLMGHLRADLRAWATLIRDTHL